MNIKPLVTLTCLILVFISCSKNNYLVSTKDDKFDTLNSSYERWKKIKNKNNNTYSYSTEFISWVGFGSKSTFFIEDDIVVKKVYESWNDTRNITSNFIEKRDDIGKNIKGAKPKTIDELYNICKLEVLSKNIEYNYIYLSYDKNIILKVCTYSNKNCADDCSKGVRISDINFKN